MVDTYTQPPFSFSDRILRGGRFLIKWKGAVASFPSLGGCQSAALLLPLFFALSPEHAHAQVYVSGYPVSGWGWTSITSGDDEPALTVSGGAIVTSSTLKATTSGKRSHGLFTKDQAEVELKNSDIKTNGDSSSGLYVDGLGSSITGTNINVTTSGADAHAAYLTDGGKLNMIDSSLTASGQRAGGLGIGKLGTGEVRATLTNVDIASDDGPSIFAEKDTLGELTFTDVEAVTNNGRFLDVTDGGSLNITGSSSQFKGEAFTASTGTSNLNLRDESVWTMTGSSNLTSLVNSASRLSYVAPSGSAASAGSYKTLMINGDYQGIDGTIEMNTYLADDASPTDRMHVTGNISGKTGLLVNPTGGPGAKTDQGIMLVQVDGTSASDAFYLGNSDPLEIDIWTYDLEFGSPSDISNQNWYLRSVGVSPAGAVYESAPSILLGSFARLPTFEQRVGQRQWLLRNEDGVDGAWVRLHGERARIKPSQSDSDASWRSNTGGVQVGADFLADEDEHGYWVLGVTGQYGHVSADITNAFGDGHISGTGYGIGATATWHGYSGTYLDFQGQANWISADYLTTTNGSLASGRNVRAYGLSAELGHRHMLDDGGRHVLVPQAQLSWARINGSSFIDSQQNDISLGASTRTRGRIGFAYEYRPNGMVADHRKNDEQIVYGVANILHDFSSATTVSAADTDLYSKGKRTWGEIGIGSSVSVAQNTMLYGEASYRQALSGRAANNNSIHGTVGLRFEW